jgi:hypothetical protein
MLSLGNQCDWLWPTPATSIVHSYSTRVFTSLLRNRQSPTDSPCTLLDCNTATTGTTNWINAKTPQTSFQSKESNQPYTAPAINTEPNATHNTSNTDCAHYSGCNPVDQLMCSTLLIPGTNCVSMLVWHLVAVLARQPEAVEQSLVLY